MTEDPLNKLKQMYSQMARNPAINTRSAPGDRLREAAGRLEAAIRVLDREEVLSLTRQVERELYHLERFIRESQVVDPQAQAVDSRYQAGVQAHQQGWLALAQAVETGDLSTCADAVRHADEGDSLLAQAEAELQTLREQQPMEG